MILGKLPANSKPIDDLLRGGIEVDVITNIFGPPGSGKTNLCFLFMLSSLKQNKKAIFIDSENNFSLERFFQIGGKEEHLRNILYFRIGSFDDQKKVIKKLETLIEKKKNFGIIVIDSFVSLYRLKICESNVVEMNRELARQLSILSNLSQTKRIPVLITSQVYEDFETKKVEIVSRDVVKYWSKCLIELKKLGENRREAILRKHRALPEGRRAEFEIVENGISQPKFKLF